MSGESLILLGDFLLPPGSMPPRPEGRLAEILCEAKHVCCNLEGIPAGGFPRFPKVGAWTEQDSAVVEVLRTLKVNLFCLANNHVGDHGPEALAQFTSKIGDSSLGVGKGPVDAARPRFVNLDGARIALLACAEGEFGVLVGAAERFGACWMGHPALREAILEARKAADFVVVQVHTGVEETGFPLPKAREALRFIVDLGADLVVCHHAHRWQGWEAHRGGTILHGLGNAYFPPPMRQPPEGWNRGLAVRVGVAGGKLDLGIFETSFEQARWSAREQENWLAENELPSAGDPEYLLMSRILAESLWEGRYRAYYRSALGAPGSWKETLRSLGNLVGIRDRRSRIPSPLLLLHNIRIESHRWAVEHYLEDSIP